MRHKQITININNHKITCDKKIAPLIKNLNEQGFKTLFSCCNSPYVMIKMPKSKKQAKKFIQLVRKFYHDKPCREITYNVFNHGLTIYMSNAKYSDKMKYHSHDEAPIPHDLQ